VGSFEVGKDFDALLIDTMAQGAPFDTFWCEWAATVVCLSAGSSC